MPQREAVDWQFPIRVIDVVVMGLYRQIGWLRRVSKSINKWGWMPLSRLDWLIMRSDKSATPEASQVFLARSLVQQAELVILDEPFAGVDAVSESIIARELSAMRRGGTSVLLVHHDLVAVRRFCDECLLLNKSLRAWRRR